MKIDGYKTLCGMSSILWDSSKILAVSFCQGTLDLPHCVSLLILIVAHCETCILYFPRRYHPLLYCKGDRHDFYRNICICSCIQFVTHLSKTEFVYYICLFFMRVNLLLTLQRDFLFRSMPPMDHAIPVPHRRDRVSISSR